MSWKAAGLSYLKYSNIAAKTLRSVLKAEVKVAALKREEIILRRSVWENGKQGPSVSDYNLGGIPHDSFISGLVSLLWLNWLLTSHLCVCFLVTFRRSLLKAPSLLL